MEEDREKRHRFKRPSSVDWISSLPDCLLSQILSNLPTKDAVKTSVLSTRWRSLWKQVPSLDLANFDFSLYFPYCTKFLTFVDSFLLDLNRDSCLHEFKLKYDSDGETDHLSRWINTLVKRKVKHIDIVDESNASWDFPIPTTLYSCESLVSLKLSGLTLPNPNLVVSLPSLKTIYLTIAKFADETTLERLIPQCPVLESLGIDRSFCDDVQVLRVRSRSLLRFTHLSDCCDDSDEEFVVEIDAPKLEYFRVGDHRVASFVLKNVASLVEADIDTVFSLDYDKSFDPNDGQKRNVIRGFLVGISRVKDMTIASSTLEVIYDYSRCEQLPLFRNLTFLRVEFYGYRWEMLPVFLESCPNLKSLVVGSIRGREKEGVHILFEPQCFLPSLEYVKIERPLKGEAMEIKLVSYLLENSTILKKLTLLLDVSREREESDILKELLSIPRLSSSCQVVAL
ncbi:hypothetical protein YC2023_093213 [Brassica napus]|uniref:(rape) hypothetical protein n=1 Tax=Brassica napus TaxID=3708 RepID=A0A816ZHG9_BRANA|nr:unnamed protein product [Brassica napus]